MNKNFSRLRRARASPTSDCGFGAVQVRRAGCIWLLSLISYTGRHQRLLPLLPTIQDAFSHLLGDRDELTQASPCPSCSPSAHKTQAAPTAGRAGCLRQLPIGHLGVLMGKQWSAAWNQTLYTDSGEASLVTAASLLGTSRRIVSCQNDGDISGRGMLGSFVLAELPVK